jgi:tRNA pseudouridine32 synthase/23S rRNA pseudouridine746 synthase
MAQQPSPHVLAEHEDFILVSKPVGVCMHQNDGEYPILAQLQRQGYGDSKYLVHRLDTDTSGLMIVAKTSRAAGEFGRLFEQQKIAKYYLALGQGKAQKKQGHIAGDMAKVRNGNFRLLKTKKNPAYTQFFSSALPNEQRKGLRLYTLRPLTGKTHQLRVALKSISAPIVGDVRYGSLLADRMYLHAYQITFAYAGQPFNYVSPPASGELWNTLESKSHIANMTPPDQLDWPKPIMEIQSGV